MTQTQIKCSGIELSNSTISTLVTEQNVDK